MASYGRGSFGGFSQKETSSGSLKGGSPDQQITNDIQTVSNNVLLLRRLVDQIGTKLDSEDLRSRIKETLNETNSCVKRIHQLLGNLPVDPPENEDPTKWKVKKRLLSENFHDVLKTYQDMQHKTKEKMRATLRRSLVKSAEVTTVEIEIEGNGEISQTQIQDIKTELDLSIVKAREEEILELEKDIVDLADIFKDLNKLVHEQGEQVDNIEKNIDDTAQHIEQAKEDLKEARKAASSARKKTAFILLIVGSVVAVVVVLVVLGALKKI